MCSSSHAKGAEEEFLFRAFFVIEPEKAVSESDTC